MRNSFKVALFSVLGACTLNVVLIACSFATGGGADPSPEGTAHAQPSGTAPAACAQWEVKAFVPTKFTFKSVPYIDGDGNPNAISVPVAEHVSLPPGWEPFAAEGYGAVTARHCLD